MEETYLSVFGIRSPIKKFAATTLLPIARINQVINRTVGHSVNKVKFLSFFFKFCQTFQKNCRRYKLVVNMNFLFNVSRRTNKIFHYSFSACAGNQVRDVRAFLFIAGIAIIYALTVSGECYLCYPFLLTAAFCQLPVTVYSFVTTIIFFLCQFPVKGQGL